MTLPLMPKATAVWLVENTGLTFTQIATFCGMHVLEVQGIADGEVAGGISGKDPIPSHQLSREEITRCEADEKAFLCLSQVTKDYLVAKSKNKKSRYTPVARRQDKPDAILWLIKNLPTISDTQIVKLIGTTKNTIKAIRERTHWNMSNIKPKDPVLLSLCSQTELNALDTKLKKEAEKNQDKA
jgi:hypothetical protein